MPDTLETFNPDSVAGQQSFVFIHPRRKDVDKLLYFFKKSQGRIQGKTTHAKIGSHHALSADHLEDTQNFFALAEAIQENRHRADIEGMGSQPDQVRGDAR